MSVGYVSQEKRLVRLTYQPPANNTFLSNKPVSSIDQTNGLKIGRTAFPSLSLQLTFSFAIF
jgi:hypothetical protein